MGDNCDNLEFLRLRNSSSRAFLDGDGAASLSTPPVFVLVFVLLNANVEVWLRRTASKGSADFLAMSLDV